MNTVNVSSKVLEVIVSNLLEILKGEVHEFRNQVKQSALKHNATIKESWFPFFKSKKPTCIEECTMYDDEFWINLKFTKKISKLNSLLKMCKLSSGNIIIDSATCNLLMDEINRLSLKYSEDTTSA